MCRLLAILTFHSREQVATLSDKPPVRSDALLTRFSRPSNPKRLGGLGLRFGYSATRPARPESVWFYDSAEGRSQLPVRAVAALARTLPQLGSGQPVRTRTTFVICSAKLLAHSAPARTGFGSRAAHGRMVIEAPEGVISLPRTGLKKRNRNLIRVTRWHCILPAAVRDPTMGSKGEGGWGARLNLADLTGCRQHQGCRA